VGGSEGSAGSSCREPELEVEPEPECLEADPEALPPEERESEDVLGAAAAAGPIASSGSGEGEAGSLAEGDAAGVALRSGLGLNASSVCSAEVWLEHAPRRRNRIPAARTAGKLRMRILIGAFFKYGKKHGRTRYCAENGARASKTSSKLGELCLYRL
jgi:hypothetical protein